MQITPGSLSSLKTWVAENPSSRLFVRLGRGYLELGRPMDAALALRRGLLFMTENIETRHLLALALREMGDRAGALAESLIAARAIAEQAGVFKLLGEIFKEEGCSQKAAWASALARELALTPAPVPAEARPAVPCVPALQAQGQAGPDTATLAEIYAAQGLNQQAAAIYRRLAAQNPSDAALAARLIELEGRPVPPVVAAKAQVGSVLARLETLRRAALGQAGSGPI
jgi:tetratricopeptide (TPR) repeat protein